MSAYSIALATHVTTVVLSFTFFVIRGIWMVRANPALSYRWVRISPHIIDTILLASAIVLAVLLGQYPFVDHWLTVKLFALIGYIVLGTIALKRGRTRAIRISALIAAITLFAFIVSVAWYHDPAGIFRLIT